LEINSYFKQFDDQRIQCFCNTELEMAGPTGHTDNYGVIAVGDRML